MRLVDNTTQAHHHHEDRTQKDATSHLSDGVLNVLQILNADGIKEVFYILTHNRLFLVNKKVIVAVAGLEPATYQYSWTLLPTELHGTRFIYTPTRPRQPVGKHPR